MISAEILARREAELIAQDAPGKEISNDEYEAYLNLCCMTIGMAVELYRYEYGKLPASADELVAEEYLNQLPRNPRNNWAPVRVAISNAPGAPALLDEATISLLFSWETGNFGYVLDHSTSGFLFFGPAAVWLETEAQMHGMDYATYEQQLCQEYPDRALWPASGIVKPAALIPPAPGAKSP